MNFKDNLAILLISLCLFSTDVIAEASKPRLEAGMSYQEVLTLWGKPQSKVEKEVKRESVWVYPEGEVVFKEGTFVSLKNSAYQNNDVVSNVVPVENKRSHVIEEDWGAVEKVIDDVDMTAFFKKMQIEQEKAEAEKNIKNVKK